MFHLQERASARLLALRYALRSLGLEIVNVLLRSSPAPEAPKPVLHKSRWIAASTCSIHILPVAVSIFLIWLNNYQIYIGPGLSFNDTYDNTYLALYQVASKLMELVCVASLTTVILEILRQELLHRDGVPFGLVSSGLSFNQLSFLWSPGLILSAGRCFSHRTRWALFLLLIIASLLAATIGPSIAILLLPRITTFPAGGTKYWLNATADQLWPDRVNSSFEYPNCFLPNATEYGVCPSGGYASLKATFKNFGYGAFLSDTFNGLAPKLRALGGLHGFSLAIQSQWGLLPVLMSSGELRNNYLGFGTIAVQPPAIIAAQQKQLLDDWFYSASTVPKVAFSRTAGYRYGGSPLASSVFAPHALVRSRCMTSAQNLSRDALVAEFPIMKYNTSKEGTLGFQWLERTQNASIATLDCNFSAQIRAQWVPLSTDAFGPVSTGLLFELPWLSGNDDDTAPSRAAVGCTLQATWQKDTMETTSDTTNYAWYLQEWWAVSPYGNHTPISLDQSWLRLLTPLAPDVSASNSSGTLNTLEAILDVTGISDFFSDFVINSGNEMMVDGTCVPVPMTPNKTQAELYSVDCNLSKVYLIEVILAVLIADGLSRHQSVLSFIPKSNPQDWALHTFQLSPDYWDGLVQGRGAFIPPLDLSQVYQLNASFSLTGYAYYASGPTDYLAQAVIGLYVVIATCHIVWLIYYRVSSSAWDTIIELVALCQNSPPTAALHGTSAGIASSATYKKIVRLRSLPTPHEAGTAHIVLLFDEDTDIRKGEETGLHKGDERGAESSETLKEPNIDAGGVLLRKKWHQTPRQDRSHILERGADEEYKKEFVPANSQTWPLNREQQTKMRRKLVEPKETESTSVSWNKIQVGKKYN